jgi:hypothetical protein
MREAMSWVEKMVYVVRNLDFGGFLVNLGDGKSFEVFEK